jgi:hypothetical protein
MGVIQYTLFAYGLTALISCIVVGIILVINKVLSKPEGDA